MGLDLPCFAFLWLLGNKIKSVNYKWQSGPSGVSFKHTSLTFFPIEMKTILKMLRF